MENYTKITAEDVKHEISNILKCYIGPNANVSYKRAARELEVEERTLGSWVRGEKAISLLGLIKLSLYLSPQFNFDVIQLTLNYKYK